VAAETPDTRDGRSLEADADLLVGKATADEEETARLFAQAAANKALGATFASELFCPRSNFLSYETKGDVTSFGQTVVQQTTKKLYRDFERVVGGSAVYWPACVCQSKDLSLFQSLYDELSPWKASPYRRSRHPACVEEDILLKSPTYRRIVAMMRALFKVKVGYSIVNLYADGDDWTEYHRDNYKPQGNRMTAAGVSEDSAHNVTVGVSLGASRELRFKHLDSGMEFAFPQGNGDVFAFTTPVNSAFQHAVPRAFPTKSVGPRISVIVWGHVEDIDCLVHSNLSDFSSSSQAKSSCR